MSLDIVDLYSFYNSTLGNLTQRMITTKLQKIWPKTVDKVLSIGYGEPYFKLMGVPFQKAITFVPGHIGIMTPSTTYPVALIDDEMLPLCDNSFSLVFIVHGLEHTRDIKRFLREIWRILTPEGRAIFIVPNRGGLWSTFDTTPFGQGQPYTKSQILKLLKSNMLLPLRYERALFHWPSHRPFIHKTYEITEKVGSLCFRKLSGVIIVDTIKQIYAKSPLLKKRLILNQSIHTT